MHIQISNFFETFSKLSRSLLLRDSLLSLPKILATSYTTYLPKKAVINDVITIKLNFRCDMLVIIQTSCYFNIVMLFHIPYQKILHIQRCRRIIYAIFSFLYFENKPGNLNTKRLFRKYPLSYFTGIC